MTGSPEFIQKLEKLIGVTLGAKTLKGTMNDEYPTIGDNVIVYANAMIIGDIEIGNNVVVGGGAIVTKDIPNNSLVVGNSLIKPRVHF